MAEEFKVESAKAVELLKGACPNDLPSTPTGRLTAMETRLEAMLGAVRTVQPALDRFYQSLSDEQKARFNAVALGRNSGSAKDQRNLAGLCNQSAPGVTDLPIDRIAAAVQPNDSQRGASRDPPPDLGHRCAPPLRTPWRTRVDPRRLPLRSLGGPPRTSNT